MNRRGLVITGTVLAVTLGMGLTAMPGVSVRAANAASLQEQELLQDQELQRNLADEHFKVDWSAKQDGHGKTTISGYVYSTLDRDADHVQLRVAELDASGWPVATYLEWMLEDVPSQGRGYFAVKVPTNPDVASYQVGVYTWNTVEGTR